VKKVIISKSEILFHTIDDPDEFSRAIELSNITLDDVRGWFGDFLVNSIKSNKTINWENCRVLKSFFKDLFIEEKHLPELYFILMNDVMLFANVVDFVNYLENEKASNILMNYLKMNFIKNGMVNLLDYRFKSLFAFNDVLKDWYNVLYIVKEKEYFLGRIFSLDSAYKIKQFTTDSGKTYQKDIWVININEAVPGKIAIKTNDEKHVFEQNILSKSKVVLDNGIESEETDYIVFNNETVYLQVPRFADPIVDGVIYPQIFYVYK